MFSQLQSTEHMMMISSVLPSHLSLLCTVHALSQAFLHLTPLRLSMIEPGPVHTEFETKMMEDVAKMEYPGADADTVRYFKDVYLPSSTDIFEALGQTPDDIAKVRELLSSWQCCVQPACIAMKSNWKSKLSFVCHPSSALRRLLSQAALALGIWPTASTHLLLP